ncbi:MAG: hypothetical protein U1E52_15075 [Geminicoccaceae bacterium]
MLTAILLVTLKLCVPALVFAVGLGATASDLLTLQRRPGLLLRSLLAMYVVVPLLALAAAWSLPLSAGIKIALLVLAISAGAPLLPRKFMDLGNDAYVFSLVVLTSLLAIVTVPAWLAFLGNLFERDAPLSSGAVAKVVGLSLLLPVAAGMALHAWRPAGSERIADRLLAIVGALFGLSALALLALHLPLLAAVPVVAWLALAGLGIAALVAGHLLGGPAADDRTALAVACATRHVGISALAAATVPGEHTLVLLLAYLLVAGVLSFGYLRWRRHGRHETREAAAQP